MNTGFPTKTNHSIGDLKPPMEEDSNEDRLQAPITFKKKRSWTLEEKHAIVEECRPPGTSVSAIARKHGVPTNLLFQWRKQFEEAPSNVKLSINDQMEAEMRSTLSFIEKCRRLEQVLTGNLMEDIRARKISPYNASIALSNLVTSREKLLNLSLSLLERLQKLRPVNEDSEPEVNELDLRYRRQIEKLAMEMAEELYPPEKA